MFLPSEGCQTGSPNCLTQDTSQPQASVDWDNSSYPNVIFLDRNDQIKELQTIIRDKNTSSGDFLFYADRLIRLVIEESLNLLPYTQWVVTTPTGCSYNGVRFSAGNCGVSIVRSGEVMEKGLRECCRSMRISKILILADQENGHAKVLYAKLLPDICKRHVLLLYPVMSTGQIVAKALAILKDYGVEFENVILANVFCTPASLKMLRSNYPDMQIVTSECDDNPPIHFCEKYFGTDM